MVTLEELKRENAKLRARESSRQDMRRIQRERQQLVEENKDLRNPRSTAFKKNLGRAIRRGGSATLRFIDKQTRPIPIAPTKTKPRKKKRKGGKKK